MASSPEVVVSFLLEMSEIVKDKADEVYMLYFILCEISACSRSSVALITCSWGIAFTQEFRAIWSIKREKCGQSCALEPWDEAYYTALMKSSVFNLDSSVSIIPFWSSDTPPPPPPPCLHVRARACGSCSYIEVIQIYFICSSVMFSYFSNKDSLSGY